MTNSFEQARRRRQLNQRIRDLIAVRRAVGRQATTGVEASAAAAVDDPTPAQAA
jgi:hypothetical protein